MVAGVLRNKVVVAVCRPVDFSFAGAGSAQPLVPEERGVGNTVLVGDAGRDRPQRLPRLEHAVDENHARSRVVHGGYGLGRDAEEGLLVPVRCRRN